MTYGTRFAQRLMMTMIATLLAVMPLAASAQTAAPAVSVSRLITQYGGLAGSSENATSLINGLRDGKQVLLRSDDPAARSTTFHPATGHLGLGNVSTALALAQAALARQGISQPTPEQLAAALNGGASMTPSGTVTFAGVLAQRQSGIGWGQIANAMGVKLGAVISAAKANKPLPATKPIVAGSKKGVGGPEDSSSEAGRGASSGNNGGGGNHGNGGSRGNSGGGGGGGRSK